MRTKRKSIQRKSSNPRPSYDQSYVAIAEAELSKGMTIRQLAKSLGVSSNKIKEWGAENPLFEEAVKKGRQTWKETRWAKANEEVECSLLKRAKGYEYVETTIESVVLLEKGEEVSFIESTEDKDYYNEDGVKKTKRVKTLIPGVKRKVTIKQVQPDVMAAMFWLQNRQPEDWKNVQRQIVEGEVVHDHKHTLAFDELVKLGKDKLEDLSKILRVCISEDAGRENSFSATRRSGSNNLLSA